MVSYIQPWMFESTTQSSYQQRAPVEKAECYFRARPALDCIDPATQKESNPREWKSQTKIVHGKPKYWPEVSGQYLEEHREYQELLGSKLRTQAPTFLTSNTVLHCPKEKQVDEIIQYKDEQHLGTGARNTSSIVCDDPVASQFYYKKVPSLPSTYHSQNKKYFEK